MASWDSHLISVVGPVDEIKRFVADLHIVQGTVDEATGDIADGWDSKPEVDLGPRQYIVERCWINVCHVEIQFESRGRFVSPAKLYHDLAVRYPKLRIQWRYWCDMGCECGYVDDLGDHSFTEEKEGEWVAQEISSD